MHRDLIAQMVIGSLVLVVGCDKKPSASTAPADTAKVATEATVPQVIDDPESVAAIEQITDKSRRDGNGAVIDVDYRGLEIDDSALAPLTGLKRLRAVRLAGTNITGDALQTIGMVSTLESLDLRNCKLSNADLAHLEGLSKLKELRLSGENGACDVDDEGMKSLAKLPNLKALSLDFLWISEEGLKELAELPDLQELNLADASIGNEAISILSSFPSLRRIRLSKTRIDALGDLPKFKQLEEIDLSECASLQDTAMEPLGQIKTLKKLNLWRVPISDVGVSSLAGLSELESLNLDNTMMGDDGLPALGGMKKLTFLHLGSTRITDTGLVHLEDLTALKDLKVTRTSVTQAGVDKLKEKLTDTEIQLEYIAGQ